MYEIKVNINNVSLRPFLFLQDLRNKGKEFSNTTVCDYILDNYKELFEGKYKDSASFRSGYAGNFSLLFDSEESQNGNINKSTKKIPKELLKILPLLKKVIINFDDKFCYIKQIPDEKTYKLLCVFFCLKRINAQINKVVALDNPLETWVPLLAKKLGRAVEDFPANKNQITGRGDTGRKSTINRYTIYNRGNNWFDLLKPNYYNFKNLRYKLFLHNLMIEQDNLYICILKNDKYNFDFEEVFDKGLIIEDKIPQINTQWIKEQINFNDILLVKKSDFRDLILENVSIPASYQFNFTLLGSILNFQDGTSLDIRNILITDDDVLDKSANLNPNITIEKNWEQRLIKSANENSKKNIAQASLIRRCALNGEESNTIMKFLDLSFTGRLIINDYKRNSDNSFTWLGEKKCLIIYNGTKYPDLLCVFLEDAEKIIPRGELSYFEYANFILERMPKFEHLIFQVEAEYNLVSFKDHDESLSKVLQSKYIFCENKNVEYYESKFGVKIPAISIKDFQK